MKRVEENKLVKTTKNVLVWGMLHASQIKSRLIILFEKKQWDEHYKNVIVNIQKSGRKTLRFAAYVMYDSDYGVDALFVKMMERNSGWDPRIVVVPDISRGKSHARKLYQQTRQFFISKYGKEYVVDGWNLHGEFYDHIDEFDVVYYNSPYDSMAHPYHKIRYSTTKNVLPIYITYGYEISKSYTLERYRSLEINCLWKCYTDTIYSYNDYRKYQTRKGKNVELVGYSKMDNFVNAMKVQGEDKKTILIASHHTVDDPRLPLSNFLKYYNLLVNLPKLFPEIHFIFRPHPLLFTTLINKGLWKSEKVQKYLERMEKNGIEYSSGGDYFDLFSRADAIINDCGSFTIEWLFTGKPGCFMRNSKLRNRQLTSLMNKALAGYEIARNKDDIISFVSKIQSDSFEKESGMKSWVKDGIAINYPNVSDVILLNLYNAILGSD